MQVASSWCTLAARPVYPLLWCACRSRKRICISACRTTSSIPQRIEKQKTSTDDSSRRSQREGNNSHQDDRLGYVGIRSQRRYSAHDDPELINTQSLAETLQAHQQANRDAPVIRYHNSGHSDHAQNLLHKSRIPTEHRSTKFRSIDLEEGQTIADFKHLDLERYPHKDSGGKKEDYEGQAQKLAFDWEIVGNVPRYLRLPWMKELDQSTPSRSFARERLEREIRAADAFFTPTQDEIAAAARAHRDIADFVTSEHQRLDIIGSRASGLASPLSDLDLNLVVTKDTGDTSTAANMREMGDLYKSMRYSRKTNLPFTVSYFASLARVPIIVGVHGTTGLEFQIQSASSGYGSLEVTKGLAAEFLSLRALFKILKQMLKMHGLFGSSGGLTSYPLLNMIAVALKRNATEINSHDPSQNLINFFDFWSNVDFYKHGIMHVPGRHLWSSLGLKKSLRYEALPDLFRDEETASRIINAVTSDPVGARVVLFDVRKDLGEIHSSKDNFKMVLHDPANPYNDLGRSAHLIKHIQATFLDVGAKLKKDLSDWDRMIRTDGQAGEKSPSLLRSLIEGDYSMYNLERKRLTTSRPED